MERLLFPLIVVLLGCLVAKLDLALPHPGSSDTHQHE